MAGQITGAEAVLQALIDGVAIDRVLVDREKDTQQIRQLCEEREIPLDEAQPMICGVCLQQGMSTHWR